MTSMRRNGSLILALAAAFAVSGCATVERINPFHKSDAGPAEVASEGNRIAINAPDEAVAPAEGLKGRTSSFLTPRL